MIEGGFELGLAVCAGSATGWIAVYLVPSGDVFSIFVLCRIVLLFVCFVLNVGRTLSSVLGMFVNQRCLGIGVGP